GHGPHAPPQPSSAQTCAPQVGVHATGWQAPAAQPYGQRVANSSNAHTPALQVPGARDDSSVCASRQRAAGATLQVQSASGGASGATAASSTEPSTGPCVARDEHATTASAIMAIAGQHLPPGCIARSISAPASPPSPTAPTAVERVTMRHGM